jgi:superfamily II DNA/RNA helicase
MKKTFAQLGLPAQLLDALTQRQIKIAFPVQESTIPDALAGRDVSAEAPTGSGKTLAFGLPLMAMVARGVRNQPRGLVLAPTRELAEQIKQELAPYARVMHRQLLAVYGGVGYGGQKSAMRRGVDVLVATPGRLEDLVEQGIVDLGAVDLVVVDEADRMADMGFMPAVRRILDRTSGSRQTLLFSATLDGDVAALAQRYQRDPVRHTVAATQPDAARASHHFWLITDEDRLNHTVRLINEADSSIVFTRTRHRAERLAKQLHQHGVEAVALHGGRTQNQRTRALSDFSTGRARALIATDVAARGIHVDAVGSVIHFDPPADSKDYLHRSGRTARAGASGTVVSLVTGEQRRAVQRMQRELNLEARIDKPPAAGSSPRSGASTNDVPGRRQPDREPALARSSQPGTTVYVSNLPWKTTTADLRQLFGRYGEITDTTIITDRNGRSKGFGFVSLPTQAAPQAISDLHGFRFEGRDLTVRLARPQT